MSAMGEGNRLNLFRGVWNILVSLGVEHTHLRPEQIRPDAEWDRDLGID
jgi:hypothetical protein